jgi:Zn-dependent peptidase ImmA (M78 family)
MGRNEYYEQLKSLAREKRHLHNVTTTAFGLREVRKIYKTESVDIDHWPLPSKIKALYMCDDGDCSVAIQRDLPDEPKLFALLHELKHHYCDRELLGARVIHCGDYDANELIEKGAEVFAAEFIYPEADFARDLSPLGIKVWKPEDVVTLKRNCKARVSYRFLCKRLERLGVIVPGQFDAVQFKKLEDQIFGIPFYRSRKHRVSPKGSW